MSMYFLKLLPTTICTILAKHLHKRKTKPTKHMVTVSYDVHGNRDVTSARVWKSLAYGAKHRNKTKAEGKQRLKKGNKHSEDKKHIHTKWIRWYLANWQDQDAQLNHSGSLLRSCFHINIMIPFCTLALEVLFFFTKKTIGKFFPSAIVQWFFFWSYFTLLKKVTAFPPVISYVKTTVRVLTNDLNPCWAPYKNWPYWWTSD